MKVEVINRIKKQSGTRRTINVSKKWKKYAVGGIMTFQLNRGGSGWTDNEVSADASAGQPRSLERGIMTFQLNRRDSCWRDNDVERGIMLLQRRNERADFGGIMTFNNAIGGIITIRKGCWGNNDVHK